MARRTFVPVLLLAALILAAFSGVADNDFVPYDDDLYVTRNPAVLAGPVPQRLAWAFTSAGYASNWHPLTWISHMADVGLFGLDARRHHEMNLIVFLAGCLVLFHALETATGARWRSFFAVALFAIHPLRVESVAWLAERKDVLSFFFAMLTITLWVTWMRHPRARAAFAATVVLFCMALLAKSAAVVLPPLLLLLTWWPLGVGRGRAGAASRSGTRAAAGAGWLMLPAAVVAIVALAAQRAGGGLLDRAAPPFGLRLANAAVSPAAYLGKLFFPRDLAVFYPFPASIPGGTVLAALLLLAGVSAGLWLLRRRQPAAFAGWLWYLAALAPTLGLIPIGGQALADRYTLLPSLGLTVGLVWLGADLAGKWPFSKMAAVAASAGVLAPLVGMTRTQVGTWRDGTSLFTHALNVTRDNWHIEHEFGVLLANARHDDEAAVHLRESLRLRPDHVLAHYNLAGILMRQGQAARAAEEYRQVLRLRPDFVEAHVRLGRALAAAGRWEEAFASYAEALRLDPGHAGAIEGRRRALAALER